MTLEAKTFNPRHKTGIFILEIVLIFSGLFFNACSEPEEHLIDIRGEAQGTYYAIKYLADSEVLTKNDFDAIFAKIDSSLSTYQSYSLITKFNREDSLITKDPLFIEMLMESAKVYHQSNGAFDPTVMPLVRAWGFGPEGKEYVADQPLDSIMKLVGWNKLIIDYLEDGSLLLKKGVKGMQLDFNAIAQGYASDLIADELEKKGITNYLVDSGGELLAKGHNNKGEIWSIGIDRPEENSIDRQLIAILKLDDKAVATSGNYRKFYIKDGVKYSHTISPSLGIPVEHSLLSATVITDTCSMADAYATALMVMGLDESIAFIEALPHVEAYLVFSDPEGKFKSYQSTGLAGMIKENE